MSVIHVCHKCWGAFSENFIAALGLFWRHFGDFGDTLGPLWGHLGVTLGTLWVTLGLLWGHFGGICFPLWGHLWRQFHRKTCNVQRTLIPRFLEHRYVARIFYRFCFGIVAHECISAHHATLSVL
jgi:hypothetical protein